MEPAEWRWRRLVAAQPSVLLSDLDSAGAGQPGRPLHAHLRVLNTAYSEHTTSWPTVWVEMPGADPCPVHLAPSKQWEELAEPLLAALEPPLQHAIAAHVTSGIRRCLGRCMHHLLGAADVVLGLQEPPPPNPAAQPARGPMLEIRIQASEQTTGWTAMLPLARLPVLRGAEPGHEAPHKNSFDPHLPVVAVLGTQRVTPKDLLQLEVGDTLLLNHAPERDTASPNSLPAWLTLGEHVLCRWQAGAVVEVAPPHTLHRSTPMDSTTGSSLRGELTVPVEVAVSAPAQRLGEIQRWAPGSLVTLACPVDGDQLTLRAGGRTLARGRLAAVGDLLAFEIIELYE
jgi:flagellar motor switch/type III secretory pathway protein FliN